jgi:hypothetical protein
VVVSWRRRFIANRHFSGGLGATIANGNAIETWKIPRWLESSRSGSVTGNARLIVEVLS